MATAVEKKAPCSFEIDMGDKASVAPKQLKARLSGENSNRSPLLPMEQRLANAESRRQALEEAKVQKAHKQVERVAEITKAAENKQISQQEQARDALSNQLQHAQENRAKIAAAKCEKAAAEIQKARDISAKMKENKASAQP